jgi:hypothetical protein
MADKTVCVKKFLCIRLKSKLGFGIFEGHILFDTLTINSSLTLVAYKFVYTYGSKNTITFHHFDTTLRTKAFTLNFVNYTETQNAPNCVKLQTHKHTHTQERRISFWARKNKVI